VRYVEDQLEAWLDEFDSAIDILSAVVNLLAVDPALDLLGVDALVQFFEGVTDAGSSAIRAGLTNALMDDLACSGFCQMYRANNKTFSELILLAWEQQDHTLLEPAKWAMLETAERLPLSKKFRYYDLGKNDPDPDWSILCDCVTDETPGPVRFAGTDRKDFGSLAPQIFYSQGKSYVDISLTVGTTASWRDWAGTFFLDADSWQSQISVLYEGEPGYLDWHDAPCPPRNQQTIRLPIIYAEGITVNPASVVDVGTGAWLLTYNMPTGKLASEIKFPGGGWRLCPRLNCPAGTTAYARMTILAPGS